MIIVGVQQYQLKVHGDKVSIVLVQVRVVVLYLLLRVVVPVYLHLVYTQGKTQVEMVTIPNIHVQLDCLYVSAGGTIAKTIITTHFMLNV
jgi:hypothetical protein